MKHAEKIDLEAEQHAIDAWVAIDKLSLKDPKAIRQNAKAIAEMYEKLGTMIAEAKLTECVARLDAILEKNDE